MWIKNKEMATFVLRISRKNIKILNVISTVECDEEIWEIFDEVISYQFNTI